MRQADVIILGAGVVGVCAALHLQARGRRVALLDRREAAGRETSFGNAGLIERSSLIPYLFPRDPRKLVRYALNLLPEAHYHASALPALGPWLMRYWRASAPEKIAQNIAARRPLIEASLTEHEILIQQAGAGELIRKCGWIKLHRNEETQARAAREAEELRGYGLHVDTLDGAGVAALEPDLAPVHGGVHFRDTAAVTDPAALTHAYIALFIARGGQFYIGDAMSLAAEPDGRWRVRTTKGALVARDAVVALGPWSDGVLRPLGYDLPLGWKRGYHMHYAPQKGAPLNHPVLDADNGYLLAPMTRGIRLTTGAEFAQRDAPPTPIQLDQCEPMARDLFPLGARLDDEPWKGARPCLPDMLPVLGAAPRHKGLWFDFGHAHHGLTLAACSARLLGEMMTGETPFTDPAPYRADRF